MIDTQRISFAISAPSTPSTMFLLPILDYFIPVFLLHSTRGFEVVVIVISFRHLALFLELSSSR